MIEFLSFLKDHKEALTLVFAFVVMCSTVVYALLTIALVLETRRLRVVQSDPKLEITIEPIETMIKLVRLNIRNIGQGPAQKISFEPIVMSGGAVGESLLEEFLGKTVLRNGLEYLGPGEERKSTFTEMDRDFEAKSRTVIRFVARYRNANGQLKVDTLTVDMSELEGYYQIGKPPLHSIVQSLQLLQKDVQSLVRHRKRLRIDTYDNDDRVREQEERTARHADWKRNQQSSDA